MVRQIVLEEKDNIKDRFEGGIEGRRERVNCVLRFS